VINILSRGLWFLAAGVFACLFAIVNSSVASEKGQITHPPITIYITGSNLPVAPSPPRSSPATLVIDKTAIERMQPRSVPQLLATIPGLHIENAMMRGSVSTVYQRGAEPNYTLVMINGVKVNDPTSSRGDAFDFSLLDINSIERIEVVNGPYSSVYGSAAMAGVINIITHTSADRSTVEVGSTLGSRRFASATVKGTSVFNEGSLSVRAAYHDDGEPVTGSQFVGKSLNAEGNITSAALAQLSFNARYHDSTANSFPGASGGDEYAIIRQLDARETQQQQLGVRYKQPLKNETLLIVRAGFFKTQEALSSPGVEQAVPANTSNTDYARRNVALNYQLKPTNTLRAVIGLELEREQGGSNGTLDINGAVVPTAFDLVRHSAALFAEAEHPIKPGLYGTIGVRIDKTDGFEVNTSPRLGLDYRQGATNYQINWSQGFKLPSFFALGHPIVGNADFQPETSETYDIGVKHSLKPNTVITASVYYNRYFDLIDFDNSGVLVARPEVQITGVDLGATDQLAKNVSLSAYCSFLTISIKNSDKTLNKRPKRVAGLALNWAFRPAFHLSMQMNYVGKIPDFSFPTGQHTLDSRTRLDTALRWRVSTGWQLTMALNNLLNNRYEESVGVTVSGVSAHMSLQGNL